MNLTYRARKLTIFTKIISNMLVRGVPASFLQFGVCLLCRLGLIIEDDIIEQGEIIATVMI